MPLSLSRRARQLAEPLERPAAVDLKHVAAPVCAIPVRPQLSEVVRPQLRQVTRDVRHAVVIPGALEHPVEAEVFGQDFDLPRRRGIEPERRFDARETGRTLRVTQREVRVAHPNRGCLAERGLDLVVVAERLVLRLQVPEHWLNGPACRRPG